MHSWYRKSTAKIIAFFLASNFALFSFYSCFHVDNDSPAPPPEQQAAVILSSEATPAPETAPTPPPTPVSEPPYKGDGSKYAYITTDERDRKWEEDIVYLADTFLHYLHGHPKLIDRQCAVIRADGDAVEKISTTYEHLFDPALRDQFIGYINALILSIHDSSDPKLLYGCSEVIALLGDAHSNVFLPLNEVFPLGLVLLYPDEIPAAYIYAAPKGREELLLSRLDAINGVSVSEIITRAEKVIPHESITLVYHSLFGGIHASFVPCMLLNCDLLRYIGVLGTDSTAVFSLTDESGASRETVLSSCEKEMMLEMEVYHARENASKSIAVGLMHSNDEMSGWYRVIDDGNALYIRFNSCAADTGEIVNEAVSMVSEGKKPEYIIIDFRGNPGGTNETQKTILTAIDAFEVLGGKYVLIDSGSASAAVVIPVILKRFCKDVMLVGSPAGEPPNRLFQTSMYTTPNLQVKFHMSVFKQFFLWPGYDEVTLMPDVLIGQSLEDYRNGIDSVLKYVLKDDGQQ